MGEKQKREHARETGCSKLTTSFVNVSLKFQTLITELYQYFSLKNCEKLLHCNAKASHIFSTKKYQYILYLSRKTLYESIS